MQLNTLPIHRLNELMEKKEVSCLELTKTYLNRISQMEDKIRAFITITEEEALNQAGVIDKKRMQGEDLSPLAGMPVIINDNICTAGIRTTCASKILADYIPPCNASVVEKLKNAGSILIGKSNMDEFGMGSTTENSSFHVTRNPYYHEAVPGGSSGGSAASVAAGEAAFALGTDTGGGIRQPAAFCGVIGFKPTYGYVSRTGLISCASSLDQIGPFSRDMTDLALILNTICGHDGRDSTSASVAVPDFTNFLINDVKGLKIGLPQEYFNSADYQVKEKIQEAAGKLEELGAVCEEVWMPHYEYAQDAHYIISSAEASSGLARYDGVRYGLRVQAEDVLNMFRKTRGQGFGREVKERILLGTYVLSQANFETYYAKALKIRTLSRQEFNRVFEKVDCLLTPVSSTTAYKIGEKTYQGTQSSDACTVPGNLAGVPALSLPFGLADGMPVGIQLIGRHFNEGALLRVGYTLEQNTHLTCLKPD